MKKFILENWFKLMLGPSLLMASFGFMFQSISTANANSRGASTDKSNYRLIPVNSDGTISVKLSEEQLKAITPHAIQDVNVAQLNGWEPDVRVYGTNKRVTLGVTVMNQ